MSYDYDIPKGFSLPRWRAASEQFLKAMEIHDIKRSINYKSLNERNELYDWLGSNLMRRDVKYRKAMLVLRIKYLALLVATAASCLGLYYLGRYLAQSI